MTPWVWVVLWTQNQFINPKLNILWHYSPNNSAVFYIYILMKKANRIHDSCHLGFNIIRFLWLLNI